MGKRPERHPVAVDFGARVREYRQERQWSQEKLAERADLHWTYVGSVERGERNISLINIVRIADAVEVSVGDLFPARQ